MATFDPNNPLTKALLQSAADTTTALPIVQQNRARAAAIIHEGYDKLAMYYQFRPILFALSASSAAFAFAMLYKRPKNTEAITLYSTAGILSSGLAWFTRPAIFRPAPAPLPSVASQSSAPAMQQMSTPSPTPESAALAEYLGMIDKRVEKLDRESPGWESRTYMQLANDLGIGKLYPPVHTALTKYGG